MLPSVNIRIDIKNSPARDEGQLVPAWEPFDRRFPPEGLGLVCRILGVCKLQRQSAAGVFGALPGLMGFQTAGKVVGTAGVEGAVTAAEDIDAPGQKASLPQKT